MAQVTTLRTRLTEGRFNVVETLQDFLAMAQDRPQSGIAIVMVGEDDGITTGVGFASRLVLKGALIHAIGEID